MPRKTAVLSACLGCIAVVLPAASTTPVALQGCSEIGPPGGWAQIKLCPIAPIAIAAGDISFILDPAVFGPVAAVAVFSVNGDVAATAQTNPDGSLHVIFNSPTGGIGRLRNQPLLAITVPVALRLTCLL